MTKNVEMVRTISIRDWEPEPEEVERALFSRGTTNREMLDNLRRSVYQAQQAGNRKTE